MISERIRRDATTGCALGWMLVAAAGAARPAAGENIARGRPYTLEPRPAYSHCTDAGDRVQLTDGEYSKGHFWTQKSTVGWQGVNTALITIDLGGVQPIRGVSFNTAAGAAGVTWPQSIALLVSDDGGAWHPAGDLISMAAKDGPPPDKYAVHRFATEALRTHGRYVSLLVTPGGPYLFADEIEVQKGEPAWVAEPFRGAGLADASAYRMQLAVERRLRDDIAAVRRAATALEAGQRGGIDADLIAIEREIPGLAPWSDPQARLVLPFNELHARVFAAQARVWRSGGAAPLTVWAACPWDPLSHTNAPPRDAPQSLAVAMMRNEYRAAAFNVASAGERGLTLRLKITGLPGGSNPPWVAVHQVEWTDTRRSLPVAAALPAARREGDGYVIAVPAGLVRQVWFTFHPVDIPAGTHEGCVELSGEGVSIRLPLAVRIFPMRFPDRPAMHLGGWDYSDSTKGRDVTPATLDAVIAHLREHFVDSPWATGAVLPANRDTARFDEWVARWPGARRYCVFAAVGKSIEGAAAGTPEFDAKVRAWIAFWAAHARTRGIEPGQLIILLVDEPAETERDERILPWAKAIRAAGTGVRVWEDVCHADPEKANQEMIGLCDILCPNRPRFLTSSEKYREYFARRRAAGAQLEFYSCSGPVRLLDPYSYHRLQAWTCWQQGAKAGSFWAFSDSGGGSSWNEYGIRHASAYVPFFLDAVSVTPGKHMEAIREGVEDFEYLTMLREAAARAGSRAANQAALDRAKALLASAADRVCSGPQQTAFFWHEPKDRTAADRVRLEILECLAALESE